MRLSYAFCANAAEFTADGKLWVLGGDFDTIGAVSFPVQHPTMTLVVRLHVEPTECGHERRLRVELIDSDGVTFLPEPFRLNFTPRVKPDHPHRAVGVGLTITMQGLIFPKQSDYAFHILVDELELGTVPLYVSLVTAPPEQISS